MKVQCSIISLLIVGTVFLTIAASSLKIPKIISRRDLQTIGTLILASAVIMLTKGACDRSSSKASYTLSPAQIGKVIIPENLILQASTATPEACTTSPYSSSGGCIPDAIKQVTDAQCGISDSLGAQFGMAASPKPASVKLAGPKSA